MTNHLLRIPKKIHYCWFGGNPLTPLAEKCIESWKKYCPDYEIVEWNESNVEIASSPFMQAAYDSKKWAFVSDYARYKIVYEQGGIYLDVDVEVIKNLDDLLKNEAYIGFEGREYINSGLGFGAQAGDKILAEILGVYDKLDFSKHRENPAEISTPIIVTNILLKHGFQKNGEIQKIGSMTILPEDYLCPKNPLTRLTNITENSYSIHHYDASWVDAAERKHIDRLEQESKVVAARFPDLISIVIPVYNGQDYLSYAIESALGQTYKNTEIIVVDDGSSDRTEEIARSFGSRIKYIRKPNGGVSSALNLGIQSMRGKYFAWLSHDDVYHPEKLEILHDEIKKYDTKTIAISDWDIINEDGKFVRHYHLDSRLETTPMSFLAFDRKTWLNACAMLIPKTLFDEAGLFDEKLRTTQDYDMHMRMIEHGATYKIVRRQLFFSRAHAMQGSLVIGDNTLLNSDNMHAQIISRISKAEFDDYFHGSPKELAKVYHSFTESGYANTPAAIVQKTIDMYGTSNVITRRLMEEALIGFGKGKSEGVLSKVFYLIDKKQSKPRIMFCSGYWLTGGMERVLSNIFYKLSTKYEIILLTPVKGTRSDNPTIPIPKGVTHLTLSNTLYKQHFDVVALTYAKLIKVDVVVGFLNLNEMQLRLYEHCLQNNIKTIASNHEYYFFPYRSPSPEMRALADRRKMVFKKLDAVLWLTNFSTAVHNIDADNGYLMPNPNTFVVSKSMVKKLNSGNIICVGRFNDHVKRVDKIIDVFGRVEKINPNVTLTIVGEVDRNAPTAHPNHKSIDELIKKYKIPIEKITFAGVTSDITKLYSAADLILLTSESEGFPMVLTEAMCHGLPVICTDIPGIEDIVIDGHNGFIAKQEDIVKMAELVTRVISDNTLRTKLGQNAKKYVDRFSAQHIANKWDQLIEAVTTSSDVKKVLKTVLPYDVGSRSLFEARLIGELEESVKQSIIMAKSLEVQVTRERAVAKAFRLARATKRDYVSLGARQASKKALIKVSKKTANVIGVDRLRNR